MIYALIRDLTGEGVSVALACRVLLVSRAGYYEWRDRPPLLRAGRDAALVQTIATVHASSRATYGAPRVHAELRLGLGITCGRKRVARLMREAGLAGVCHRRKRSRGGPLPAVHEDLVQRRFAAEAPNRLWVTDVTEHPTGEGKVYCAAVLDVSPPRAGGTPSRMIVGWSIADHMKSELVVDALEMARWRRRPEPGAIVHSDRGSQSPRKRGPLLLDFRAPTAGCRAARLDGPRRIVRGHSPQAGPHMMESFWSTMQRELLDRQAWSTRAQLGSAIFEWIEAFYNPRRRHSGIDYLPPLRGRCPQPR